jgi:hypothetical protein
MPALKPGGIGQINRKGIDEAAWHREKYTPYFKGSDGREAAFVRPIIINYL